MSDLTCFQKINQISDRFIEEAALPEEGVRAVVAPRWERAGYRFFHSGWWVAILCAVVSATVLVGIIIAGRAPNDWVVPAAPEGESFTDTTAHVTVESEPQEETTPSEMTVTTGGTTVYAVRSLYAGEMWLCDNSEWVENCFDGITLMSMGACGDEYAVEQLNKIPTLRYDGNLTYTMDDSAVRLINIWLYDENCHELTYFSVDDLEEVLAQTEAGSYYLAFHVKLKGTDHAEEVLRSQLELESERGEGSGNYEAYMAELEKDPTYFTDYLFGEFYVRLIIP